MDARHCGLTVAAVISATNTLLTTTILHYQTTSDYHFGTFSTSTDHSPLQTIVLILLLIYPTLQQATSLDHFFVTLCNHIEINQIPDWSVEWIHKNATSVKELNFNIYLPWLS